MGLNIFAVRLIEKKIDITDPRQEYSYWETDEFEFDSLRYSGDRELLNNNEIKWEYKHDGDGGMGDRDYMRPKDLNVAIKWVKENVFEGNQRRLIDLFREMKNDNKLYIGYTY